jgi:hypothetical protein
MPHCNGADRGCACEAAWGTGRASCSPSPLRRQHHPAAKAGRLPSGLASRENLTNRLQGATQICRQRQRLLVRSPVMATWVVCPRCVSWRFLPASEGGPNLCDSTAPWHNSGVEGGLDLPTRPTRKSRHTKVKPGWTACPEAVIGHSENRQPLWHEPRREEPRSARGVCPGLSCMHRNGARTVLRGLGGSNALRLPDLLGSR